ncbi:NAD(P)/FAD-dependent oxidoreductase [Actinomycetospora sp. TBRC 11914]|uniref:flavin-containing monooxygenase n=1 Tax=Actinomycetospora sp. TBRC 11914 TaxID=2729387 RepID=UPI00145D8D17|nr:NAD(P)/FAD-dependent oxidoreductase [Actinomycetospora sp. TBRC 11914]NMO88253.1 NAD(P)/FAD-dependent oxidoreductase [Actinomycetospora sp. TBRC 11914]
MDDHATPRVLVIGSGIAGILTGIELRARGLTDFTILEKADTLGGTWRDNVYPGVACDVPAHLYSFSFAPNVHPTTRFASGPQLWDYFREIAERYRVTEHIRYGTEVADARWDGSRWTVTTTTGESLVADVVVSAVGRLQQPSLPDIPGISDFRGRVFHSARWDPAADVDGARLGIVGTGSSATQMTVATAPRVAHLDLFQRTAQWIFPMDNTPIPWWRRTLMRLVPGYARRYRAGIKRWVDEIGRAATGDPRAADERRQACVDALNTVRDPDLRAKLTPDYEVGCKRLVISGEFYDAVQRDNVEVVTAGIQRVEADGVRTTDGELHELDTLVLATGFHADAYLRPMTVTGEDGITLDDIWADVPMNYKSVALPHMPNFFLINGPFSPGGSASVLSIIEIHVGYVMQLIDRVVADRVALEPDPDRSAELLAAIREQASKTVWGTGGCSSWYLDRNGVPLVNPILLDDLAADMAHPEPTDFHAVPR